MAKKKGIKKDELQFNGTYLHIEEDKTKLTPEEEAAIGASKVTELREHDAKLMEDIQKEKEKEEKGKKYRKWMKIAIVVLIILLLIARCSAGYVDPNKKNPLDIGLQVIETPAPTESELPKDFMDWHLTIAMNETPVFEDGLSKGKLLIENDEKNVYPFYVEIYLVEKGVEMETPIYRSGVIMPGDTLIHDRLAMNLPAGVYQCVAYFNAVSIQKDPDTGKDAFYLEGKAGSKITITVKNTVSSPSPSPTVEGGAENG